MKRADFLVVRFAAAAKAGKSKVEFTEENTCFGFDEIWERSARCAGALTSLGISRGDRIALPMATTPGVVIALGALLQIGATIVPLRGRRRLRPEGNDREACLAGLRAGRAHACLVPADSRESYEDCLQPSDLDISLVDLDEILARDATPLEFEPPRADDGLILQFSSGSTGDPRGIYLTQKNVAVSVAATMARLEVSSADRIFNWAPLFHDLGLVGHLFLSIYAGCDLTLMPPRAFIREPLDWLRGMSDRRTTMTGAPQFAYDICMLRAAHAWERVASCDFSALRLAINGGEMVRVDACRRFEEKFQEVGWRPGVMSPAYGLADNCLLVALRKPLTPFPVRHLDRRALSEGRAVTTEEGADAISLAGLGPLGKDVQVRLYSPDQEVLALDEVGEVGVGGPSAGAFVANADGELRPSSDDGFVRTGDLGTFIDGEVYLVGRTKEILHQAGRSFACADLEHALLDCRGVLPASVAALAIPRPGQRDILVLAVEWDEAPVPELRDLIKRIRLTLLRKFQLVPQELIVGRRGTLPRTSSGKLKRLALREAYVEGNLAGLLEGQLVDRTDSGEPVGELG